MHAHSPAPGPRLRWLVTLSLVLSSSTALATIVAFETVEQMAQRVPLIVRGQVARTVAGWDAEHRRIWTWTELVVTDVVKGRAGRVVLVKQPGGEVDGIGQQVSGAARFREGEDCLLFLEAAPDEPGTWRTSGLSAGKVELRDWLGQRAALRNTDGIAFARPGAGRVEAVRSPELLGSPEDFIAKLRAVIGGGP
jgi:hypothetical protein